MKKQYKLTIIIGVLLIGCLSIGSLLAYFSDADTTTNNLVIGGNKIELIEDFQPPKELKPGTSFTKDVTVKNVGVSDCYIRIKAVFTDGDMEKYCNVDFNTSDYEYNSNDGFYYYKKVLKSGETTPSLFTTVSVKDETPEEEIKDFDIIVYAESYQSTGFSNYAEAWEHFTRNKPSN